MLKSRIKSEFILVRIVHVYPDVKRVKIFERFSVEIILVRLVLVLIKHQKSQPLAKD